MRPLLAVDGDSFAHRAYHALPKSIRRAEGRPGNALTGFMSMNLDRHLIAHKDFYWHLVKNDGDSAEKHRVFYDEYNAVMDLTAEFYLQTVEEVFIKHSLPKGEITHRGKRLDMGAIRHTALLTVEGENDDISGVGQTRAAHTLCRSIPDDMRVHYLQPKVGHYGVFNGSRFRAEIAPRIVDFALTHGLAARERRAAAPAGNGADAKAPPAEPEPAAVAEATLALPPAEGALVLPDAVPAGPPAAEVAPAAGAEVHARELAVPQGGTEPVVKGSRRLIAALRKTKRRG